MYIFIIGQIKGKLMTKFFLKFKTLLLANFLNFGGQKKFPQKIWLAQLDKVLYRNSEKPNDPIPRKQPNTQQDGRTDSPYFMGPFWLLLGVQQVQLQ